MAPKKSTKPGGASGMQDMGGGSVLSKAMGKDAVSATRFPDPFCGYKSFLLYVPNKPSSEYKPAKNSWYRRRQGFAKAVVTNPFVPGFMQSMLLAFLPIMTANVMLAECVVMPMLICQYMLLAWPLYLVFYSRFRDCFSLLGGIGVACFGTHYPFIIASIESFRQTGLEGFQKAWAELQQEINHACDGVASQLTVDADGDGEADIDEVNFISRQGILIYACLDGINPHTIIMACAHLYAGLAGIFAALKTSWMRQIYIGAALAENVSKFNDVYVWPVIGAMLDPVYLKWVREFTKRAIFMGITKFALTNASTVAFFFACKRGGDIAGRSIVYMGKKAGLFPPSFDINNTYVDEIVGFIVAGVGLYVQTFVFVDSAGEFTMPAPLVPYAEPIESLEAMLGEQIKKKW